MHVLVVDDSAEMQLLLRRIVESLGAEVAFASSAKEARASLATRKPDLLLLDFGLPEVDGFQFFAELQASESLRTIPVVFITGRSEVTNKVAAFSLGAEDYIVKPFDSIEVKARLGARLQKLRLTQTTQNRIVHGGLEVDVTRQRVYCGSGGQRRTVKLTPKEFLLLAHLARHEEQVLSRQQLLDAAWGSESDVYDRTVDTHISALRRKLGEYGAWIESVPGVGYRFAVEAKSKAA